jgi:hypothetical protein
MRPRNSVTGYPILPNGVDWMNSLGQACFDARQFCSSASETLLPKRILAFKKLPTGEISAKIHENYGVKERYNALSHCWGPSQTCVATSKTLKHHQEELDSVGH